MQELSTALGEDAQRERTKERTKERSYNINSPSGEIPPKGNIIIPRARARRTRFPSTPKAIPSRSPCAPSTARRPTAAFGDGTPR